MWVGADAAMQRSGARGVKPGVCAEHLRRPGVRGMKPDVRRRERRARGP